MCRSESVQTLCTEHLRAHDDIIGCTMYKSKTNQEGNGPKDPGHMYANLHSPATCWITALAIYMACRPAQPPGPLFPGSQQKVRFGNVLRQMISSISGLNHYGTHSIRKGVATFACSGTTGGPSIASVCLRVGWSLGGVQDRYIRYESAGDQYLGRVVAGLPLNRAEFAVLPPHFVDNQDIMLQSCIDKMFPTLSKCSCLQDILKLCIASLVCHHDHLKEKMPASHPLLTTILFRHTEVVGHLQAKLVNGISPWMKPTGIPPHVELYKQLLHVQTSIENLPPDLLEGMSNLIEEKGVAVGNIMKEMLEITIESLLQRAGLGQKEKDRPQHETASPDGNNAYYYAGKFHLLPETFEFPHTGPSGAWQLWWFGNKAKGSPPLKTIHPHDLPKRSMHKPFSDWVMMIKHLTDAITSAGRTIPVPITEQNAAELFTVAMDNLKMVPSNRKRRLAELSLTTVLRLVREAHSADKRQRLT